MLYQKQVGWLGTKHAIRLDIGFNSLPDFALEIINDGGLLEHITKRTTD